MSMQYRGVQIQLLDGSDLARSIYKQTTAKEILDNVISTLSLIEKDYFGLYYVSTETNERIWLKDHKTVWGQIVKALEPPYHLCFGVRYFPYDPLILQEDLTLYLIYLQLRREVKEGRVICSEGERAEMLAYVLQAEGGDYGGKYIHKHRNFFGPLQRSSPELETAVLETHKHLKGTEPPECEMRLMEKALPVTFYNQEMYNVRSDAQPGLKRLTLTLGPIGIGLYQGTVKLDIYGWMEIWNIGYINQTFWFRIMRDGEKSKHKFHFDDKKICEHVWKEFREYFRFYTQEKKIDPKLLWGRIPPKVNRVILSTELGAPAWAQFGIGASISRDNMAGLVPTSYADNSSLHENFGMRSKFNPTKILNQTFITDNSLIGSGKMRSQDSDFASRMVSGLFVGNSKSKNNTSTGMTTGQPPKVQFSDRTGG